MSLILEALRKSEAERRRGEAPDLLRVDPAPARATPAPWRRAWIAAPLLLVAALAAWWWRDSDAPVAVDAGAPARAAPVATKAATPTRPPATLPEIDRLQPPPAPPAAPIVAPDRVATAALPPPAPPASASGATTSAAPVAAPAPAAPVALGALPASQRKALPPLRLSMHLWNEDPARRVAILDGRRVAPGDRIGDAVVAGIRPDGVLLDWNGLQVLVPLP
jgi:general secretion pathway protein B